MYFSVFFLLLISSLISLRSENSFPLEKNVVGRVFCILFVRFTCSTVLFKFSISLSIFCLVLRSYWKWGIEISCYYCVVIYFSIKFHQCLLHVYVIIYVGYLFLFFRFQPMCGFGSKVSLLYVTYSWIHF